MVIQSQDDATSSKHCNGNNFPLVWFSGYGCVKNVCVRVHACMCTCAMCVCEQLATVTLTLAGYVRSLSVFVSLTNEES